MLGALDGWLKKLKNHSLMIGLLVLILLIGLFIYHLGSVPPGRSLAESAYRNTNYSLSFIVKHSINAPHRVIFWAINKAGWNSTVLLRSVSILFSVVFVFSFYFIAKNLFGKAVGLLGAAVFCLTPLFIIASRQGTPDILLFAPVTIMAAYTWLNRTDKYKSLAWVSLLVSAAVFIYVPGVIWWLIASAIIARRKILVIIEAIPSWIIVLGFWLFALGLIPAIISIIKDWRIVNDFAVLPNHFAAGLTILKNTGWMLASLFVKTPYHDQLIIGRAPLLDIIQIALVVFGIYAMFTAAKSKALALAAAIIFSVIVAGLNNNLHLLALGLPALAIFMAAGLRYLYIEWRGVFPLNPIPKTLALMLMIVLVSVQSIYGLSYGLVAWPHSPATKSNYVLK